MLELRRAARELKAASEVDSAIETRRETGREARACSGNRLREASKTCVPRVDVLGDARDPLRGPRHLIEAAGEDHRIDRRVRNRSDGLARALPAGHGIRVPAHRAPGRGLTELPGGTLEVLPGLGPVVADDPQEALPQRVLLLQAEEEMHVFEVGIDVLEAAEDVLVCRIGVIAAG